MLCNILPSKGAQNTNSERPQTAWEGLNKKAWKGLKMALKGLKKMWTPSQRARTALRNPAGPHDATPKTNLLLGPTAAFVQERSACSTKMQGHRNCADTSKGKHGSRLQNCLRAKQCEVNMSDIESKKDTL